jgi:hypothetical protein
MNELTATVVSVCAGTIDSTSNEGRAAIQIELDGIVGERHRSTSRITWPGDKQPEGTVRRNERHWSAVSVEELEQIQTDMDLVEPLTAGSLGANICLQGVPELSRLPKGTILKFPSGVELVVEEYNPPCHDKGKQLAKIHQTRSGRPLSSTAFSKAAKISRGLVGVVDVAGEVRVGDEVSITIYATPVWMVRSPG